MSELSIYVLKTVVTLLGVIALAVLVLQGARRMGIGRPAGPLELVGRLPLDGRRAIYLIRVGKTVYVVGASEAGLSKLGELGDEGLELESVDKLGPPFSEVLARVLRRRSQATATSKPLEAPQAQTKSTEGGDDRS
jgi:flagellar protein FliO/FliZ